MDRRLAPGEAWLAFGCGRLWVVASHIFISYCREDEDYVTMLEDHLTATGLTVFVDRHTDYGDQWPTVIRDALDACAGLVVVMTPAAEASEWVQLEVHRAQVRRKTILPLLLSGNAFFVLGTIQYEDVSGGRMPGPQYLARLGRVSSNEPPLESQPASEAVSRRGRRRTVAGVRATDPRGELQLAIEEELGFLIDAAEQGAVAAKVTLTPTDLADLAKPFSAITNGALLTSGERALLSAMHLDERGDEVAVVDDGIAVPTSWVETFEVLAELDDPPYVFVLAERAGRRLHAEHHC